jgi:hypothetical protein
MALKKENKFVFSDYETNFQKLEKRKKINIS